MEDRRRLDGLRRHLRGSPRCPNVSPLAVGSVRRSSSRRSAGCSARCSRPPPTRGGQLLKFGGDALLFLFAGEDHAAAGVLDALEMRAELRRASEIRTSVGRLNLKVSTGSTPGLPHDARRGAAPRARGPRARTRPKPCGARTRRAPARSSSAPRWPSCCRSGRSGATRTDSAAALAHRAGRRPSGAGSPPRRDAESARQLVPKILGDVLDGARPDPAHRVATISFMRFSGTDQILESTGSRRAGRRPPRDAARSSRRRSSPRTSPLLCVDCRRRRREDLLQLRRAAHQRGRRGTDAACRQGDHRRRSTAAAADRHQPWSRVRRGGRRRVACRVLRDGRHHQHRGADLRQGAAAVDLRAPGGARPLADVCTSPNPSVRSISRARPNPSCCTAGRRARRPREHRYGTLPFLGRADELARARRRDQSSARRCRQRGGRPRRAGRGRQVTARPARRSIEHAVGPGARTARRALRRDERVPGVP